MVTVSDLDEFVEAEPNDAAEQGQKVALPQGLNAASTNPATWTATRSRQPRAALAVLRG